MAEKVAYRLTAVLILIEAIEDGDHGDDGGYTLSTIRDLVECCQADLRNSVAAGGGR